MTDTTTTPTTNPTTNLTTNPTTNLSTDAMPGAMPHLCEAAGTAFPGLAVDARAFETYVCTQCPPGVSVGELALSDLYLAFACLSGVPGAVALFERMYTAELAYALRSLDPGARADARQILHARLFVGDDPKIATYTGRGPLRRWLRVVVGRIALELVAKREPIADEWEVAALPVAADDPELAYWKARYRAEYKRAFADALGALADRDRTVLAQYHVDGLTIDQLGTLYDVHRVTASRWVLKAQDELRGKIVDYLSERLGLSAAGLASVTRLVRSQLTLSLARLTP